MGCSCTLSLEFLLVITMFGFGCLRQRKVNQSETDVVATVTLDFELLLSLSCCSLQKKFVLDVFNENA